MKSVVNLLVCSAAAAALLAGLVALQPSSLAGLATLPGSQREGDQAKRAQELDDALAVALRRHDALEQTIGELTDGRVSLREAVARFRALDEEHPSLVESVTTTYPAASPDGSVCWQVLGWAKNKAGEVSPGREEEVMARLQEEARGILNPE